MISSATLLAPALAQRGEIERHTVDRLPDPSLAPSLDAALAAPGAAESFAHARAHGHSLSAKQLPRSSRSQRPAIVLTGYWPPTNEAVRRFSTDPVQNPLGWMGSNWEGRGYDVYSFFPEFTPPNCNFCGKGHGDLEVDYQDTSSDFWALVEPLRPIAVITFSRGSLDRSWEIEMNQYNRLTWINDYLAPVQPTPAPPDDSLPTDALRLSSLPVQDIVDALNASNLNVNPEICFSGNGGGFLSEFIAYHGVWYRDERASPTDPNWCVAAGHVHVGSVVDWQTAADAADVTMRTVMDYVDGVLAGTVVQSDLGFGGPGSAQLVVAGDALASGGEADLAVWNGEPFSGGQIVASLNAMPTAWNGGVVVPVPVQFQRPIVLDERGHWLGPKIPGGGGPYSAYLQAVFPDANQPQGFAMSSAVRLDFLP